MNRHLGQLLDDFEDLRARRADVAAGYFPVPPEAKSALEVMLNAELYAIEPMHLRGGPTPSGTDERLLELWMQLWKRTEEKQEAKKERRRAKDLRSNLNGPQGFNSRRKLEKNRRL